MTTYEAAVGKKTPFLQEDCNTEYSRKPSSMRARSSNRVIQFYKIIKMGLDYQRPSL